MSKTTKLDLDQDFNVNGTRYEAGKGVEVSAEHAEAIKQMQEDGAAQRAYETTHHGAVPLPDDPQEATAQTPTRPLAAPVVVEEVPAPEVQEGEVHEVKDPAAGDKGRSADEPNKDVLKGKK